MPKMSEEPSEHLTVFSSETVNIKKLANLTANTENCGQITLNTKPDPLISRYIKFNGRYRKGFPFSLNVIEESKELDFGVETPVQNFVE